MDIVTQRIDIDRIGADLGDAHRRIGLEPVIARIGLLELEAGQVDLASTRRRGGFADRRIDLVLGDIVGEPVVMSGGVEVEAFLVDVQRAFDPPGLFRARSPDSPVPRIACRHGRRARTVPRPKERVRCGRG